MCNIQGCDSKNKYGGYCYKHRENYLLSENRDIIIERYTGKSSDYLSKDIYNFLVKYHDYNRSKYLSKKKYYEILHFKLSTCNYYSTKLDQIRLIQGYYRKNKINIYNYLRGEGYYNKEGCKNTEDFNTMENITEIDSKYFFSYKDDLDCIWFFDIRSFYRLIEFNHKNPYTMKHIPEKVKINSQKIIEKFNIIIDEKDISNTSHENIKQRIIDLFSTIEQFGYECHFDWLLQLNIRSLHSLYKELEDLWNYRLQITLEIKQCICPPDGRPFTITVRSFINNNDKMELLHIIACVLENLHKSPVDSYKRLGSIYFLLALGCVNRHVEDAHNWLQFALN